MAKTQKWPADKVERRAVKSLVPYARNARTHSPEQVDQIAASIREWGWTTPVLVDEDGTIIAGHGRVMAAQKLGLEAIPVMVASGWTDAQKRAYVLADNKLALNAGWDNELLKIELDEIKTLEFDVGLIGFTNAELDVLDGNGWESDIGDPAAAHGENLDGIETVIKVAVDQDTADRVRELIKGALGDAGITFELR